MRKSFYFLHCIAAPLVCAATLLGCSPKFDWREVRGAGASYLITLPAKPASHTRKVNLGDVQTDMSMTGAEVDGITFAVGVAALPDESQAQQAMLAMKSGLVRNMSGVVKQEKQIPPNKGLSGVEVEVLGTAGSTGQPRLLLARFLVKDRHAYQLVVLGDEKTLPREEADTFFTSFRPN